MKRRLSIAMFAALMVCTFSVGAQAADYSFSTDGTPEYYGSTSYEEIYGSQYNYGGKNVVDYQIPELEYGSFSTTQTGVMEKTYLPGLQSLVSSAGGMGSNAYGITGSGVAVVLPDTSGGSLAILPVLPAFTPLTESFYLSNGAVGKISIPELNIKNYYVWEGETTASMRKGVGHFTNTSVWDGNVGICGHNRGATYTIGSIKDLDPGDKITYTTSQGTRTYAVEMVTTIRNDDWSYLDSTADNRITLITCVAGNADLRWCVQAVEV